jgi:hypothetical protein
MALTLLLSSACASSVTLEVRVHEGSGDVVEGASVSGKFFNDQVRNKQVLPSHKSQTDKAGIAEISGDEDLYVDLVVEKRGYYRSTRRQVVKGRDSVAVDIVLRKKRDPIPLYARHYKGYLPVKSEPVGFDFTVNDWVAPYGKGIHKHILLEFNGTAASNLDFSGKLAVRFPGESDGLVDMTYAPGIDSEMKLPYEAPESGYRASKVLVYSRISSGPGAGYDSNISVDENFGYFLRVNSETDGDGKIKQANYAKIGGDIKFDPRTDNASAAYIEMTYYFNPQINDRNLEFDIKRNLYIGLSGEEKVSKP